MKRLTYARRKFLGYCPSCGRDVDTDFCDHCGKPTQEPVGTGCPERANGTSHNSAGDAEKSRAKKLSTTLCAGKSADTKSHG
jgi:predicted amidophosphoribosyltransferase